MSAWWRGSARGWSAPCRRRHLLRAPNAAPATSRSRLPILRSLLHQAHSTARLILGLAPSICSYDSAEAAAHALADKARRRWAAAHRGAFVDDITVAVCFLDWTTAE